MIQRSMTTADATMQTDRYFLALENSLKHVNRDCDGDSDDEDDSDDALNAHEVENGGSE